jgi:hypothetical protein
MKQTDGRIDGVDTRGFLAGNQHGTGADAPVDARG